MRLRWLWRRSLATRVAALLLAIGVGGSSITPAEAQVVRPWQDAGRAALSLSLEPFVTGLTNPIFMTHSGDGSGRLFVVEQGGTIKVVVNAQVQSTPFLNVSADIASGGEQGLLGLAFHPNFASNGRFYVYYTPPPPNPNPQGLAGFNAVVEYRVPVVGGNQADPATKRVLFSLPDRAGNHNGGMLAFGPDGYLYVSIGDEGGSNNVYNNAQTLTTLFGKLLRIDVNRTDPGLQYAIPPSNPFVGQAGARGEIWAYGLRNPWRFSFDRANGDLWIGDVGQGLWEEVDLERVNSGGGRNYGWSTMEGTHCFGAPSCSSAGLTLPVAEYDHTLGCSITGGYVYRGAQYPSLVGSYLYSDYCTGRIWTLRQENGTWAAAVAIDTPYNVTSFGEDDRGGLYIVHAPFGGAAGAGVVYRLSDSTVAQVSCSPRPRVVVQTSPAGAGRLSVTVTATTNGSGAANTLRALQFGGAVNAQITIGGATRSGNFTYEVTPPASSATFTVERGDSRAVTVPLKVLDACGVWPTFVGIGASTS